MHHHTVRGTLGLTVNRVSLAEVKDSLLGISFSTSVIQPSLIIRIRGGDDRRLAEPSDGGDSTCRFLHRDDQARTAIIEDSDLSQGTFLELHLLIELWIYTRPAVPRTGHGAGRGNRFLRRKIDKDALNESTLDKKERGETRVGAAGVDRGPRASGHSTAPTARGWLSDAAQCLEDTSSARGTLKRHATSSGRRIYNTRRRW